MRPFLRATALVLVSACPALHSAEICWVEKVVRIDSGLKVLLIAQGAIVAVCAGGDNSKCQTVGAGAVRSFELKEGDTAALLGLHSGCEVAVVRRQGKIGVELKATASLSNSDSHTARAYVEAQ